MTTKSMVSIPIFMRKFHAAIAGVFIFSRMLCTAADASEEGTKVQNLAVFVINTKSKEGGGSGTGFACVYRGKEYVATNLHVVEGATTLSVKPQNGDAIVLSGRIIASEDADICFLGIKGTFGEAGIEPLKFMEDVFEGSKADDDILCLGNSLGNGVITATRGTIKAFGQPKLEIECPVVTGNSGGPIIHVKSGEVIGLVTEAIVNKLSFDELSEAASKSTQSPVTEISYFGHRIDTSKKWTGATWREFSKASMAIESANKGLMRAAYFLVDKSGWEEDRKISDAWDAYSKFIDKSENQTSKRVEVTSYVNEYGVVVRQDSRIKGRGISDADYLKEREKFCRAIEWKIMADQEVIKRVKPIGYRQGEARKLSMKFSNQLLVLQKSL